MPKRTDDFFDSGGGFGPIVIPARPASSIDAGHPGLPRALREEGYRVIPR